MILNDLEATIRATGLDLVRTFSLLDGWRVSVRNEVVARGQSIGEVQRELEKWWKCRESAQ